MWPGMHIKVGELRTPESRAQIRETPANFRVCEKVLSSVGSVGTRTCLHSSLRVIVWVGEGGPPPPPPPDPTSDTMKCQKFP